MIRLLVVLALLVASPAAAGGPVTLTWSQSTDCADVTGWELLVTPITTANPNPAPSAALVGVSFANNVPPCGLNMTRTVNLPSGVGPQRFWLRAVDTDTNTRSDTSNAVDKSLPLGKPSGLTVVVP